MAKLPAMIQKPSPFIPKKVVDLAVAAPTIYFAGYNDGVAEELTLKHHEITRKKSDFLEAPMPSTALRK